MPSNFIESHKKHRNILYTFVILLGILQIISLIVLSSQISKLNTEMQAKNLETKEEMKEFTTKLINSYDSLYQANFKEIAESVSALESDISKEINLLKSTQDDFSGIIEEAVKSVVTVGAGTSLGSGFIIDEAGYVVTNYHVIASDEEGVVVRIYDGRKYSASLIGKDEKRDIALLKIPESENKLTLAKDEDIQVGKKVIAIGNPLGLSYSVTEGIISALDRPGPSGSREYIQTDVSLNPGNSGGPLINLQGSVVGVNNFKIGGAESLGFALESEAIKSSINSILNQTLIP